MASMTLDCVVFYFGSAADLSGSLIVVVSIFAVSIFSS